jgi:hypothetical protein
MDVWIDGPPVVEVNVAWPVTSVPAWVTTGSELETTANVAQKVVRVIVHPCTAIDPTARSDFRAIDCEGIGSAARVAERHHGFGESGAGLTYMLDRALRSKLIDLRTRVGLARLQYRVNRSDHQQKTEREARRARLPTQHWTDTSPGYLA